MNLRDFLLLSIAALTTSCSALFQLEDEQCSTTDDCRSRHGAFEGSYCVDGYCKPLNQATGCSSNAECTGTELCLEQACTKITNAACPMVFGELNLRAVSPIVFGIFAPIHQTDVMSTVDIKNYKLAFDEFEQKLPGGPGGKHPFVGLVCNSKQMDVALPHAIQKVHIAAMIAQLESNEIVTSFQTLGHEHGVFYLSPYDADSSVTVLQDDSLIWSMIGSSTDLAPVYVPLMARIEAHLALPQAPKVALVESEDLFELDLGNAIASTMSIGGTVANSSPDFSRHSISAANPAKTEAVAAKLLTEIRPDVVISLAGDEFVNSVLWSLEVSWGPTQHPFYVLSMENRFSAALFDKVKGIPGLQARVTGVNYALPEDQTLFNAYFQRLQKAYPETADYENDENFYDTMYYLLYSYAAAGDVGAYTGADVSRGMKRLLSGQKVDVGPQGIPAGVAYLQVPNSQIALHGVMGPPDFNAGTGARISEGAVWCMSSDAQPVPVPDVLRLENGELVGEFPCFEF